MKTNRTIGGALIITGTCIGAALVALPVVTAAAGFYNTIVLFFLCWGVMTAAAFLLLEVNFWIPGEVNVISMAKQTLGLPGQVLAWLSYIMLLYAADAAYIAAGSGLLDKAAHHAAHISSPRWTWDIAVVLGCGVIVYCGTLCVDYVNRLLMVGLIITYVTIVTVTAPHVSMEHLAGGDLKFMPASVMVVIAAFAYQFVLPTLKTYMGGNIRKLTWAIIAGSLFPLLLNIVWEMVIMGTIPASGSNGLLAMQLRGEPAMQLSDALDGLLSISWIWNVVQFFVFFAISTSFLGVTMSLVDFLADALNIPRTPLGRLLEVGLALGPPLVFALFYPNGFLVALSFAGASVAVLLGILPALMVWSGRYWSNLHRNAPFRTPGGKLTPVLVFLLSSVVVVFQAAEQLDWLPPMPVADSDPILLDGEQPKPQASLLINSHSVTPKEPV